MPDEGHPLLVTVIIPTYNRREYVCQAIDSVLAQTFTDYEVIVVDDGSADDTGKVLTERYGDRICYIRQENQGESVARNKGIARARGKYLAFLDDDDLWLPDKLARQVEFLEANDDVALVGCQWQIIDATGAVRDGRPEVSRHDAGTVSVEEVVRDSPFPPSTTLVRASAAREVGGFDPSIRYGEDWDFVLRIAARYPVAYLAESLAVVRASAGSQSNYFLDSSKAQHRFMDHLKILAKLHGLLSGEDM